MKLKLYFQSRKAEQIKGTKRPDDQRQKHTRMLSLNLFDMSK